MSRASQTVGRKEVAKQRKVAPSHARLMTAAIDYVAAIDNWAVTYGASDAATTPDIERAWDVIANVEAKSLVELAFKARLALELDSDAIAMVVVREAAAMSV